VGNTRVTRCKILVLLKIVGFAKGLLGVGVCYLWGGAAGIGCKRVGKMGEDDSDLLRDLSKLSLL
jgi:hypothetical protein